MEGKKRILIVDDCDDNIFVLQAMLKMMNKDCEVVTAMCGEEAITKFKENYCTDIIMDFNMPDMNGIQTLELMSQFLKEKTGMDINELHKNFCIFTAGQYDDLKVGGEEVKVFHKPIDKKTLKEMVDN